MHQSMNEDIIQETLVILYEKYKVMEFEHGILPFAYVVLDNLIRNEYRTVDRRTHILFDQLDRFTEIYGRQHSIEEILSYEELLEEIWQALSKLTNKEKEVFRLWLKGTPITEIQQRLKLRRNTIDVRLCRASKKVKKILESRGIL